MLSSRMAVTYSTYEAKAKFSEVIRRVRAGQRVMITYRGEAIAEIRPVEGLATSVDKIVARLEDHGILSRNPGRPRMVRPIVRRPGALKRFFESRD
jgi:prevent-host-death family protein